MIDASASMRDPNCLFCRIVSKEIPADIVSASDDVVAFRDINPKAPTHVLVVPTRHIDDAAALTVGHGAILESLFIAASEVAKQEGIDQSGYRLVFNVGDDAGNTVSHLHLHLLGGRALVWPPG